MPRRCPGFTLVEMLVALVLTALLGAAISRTVLGARRLAVSQAERARIQAALRTGTQVVAAELREVAVDSAGGDGLLHLGADSVTYRAARGLGFTCAVAAAEIRIRNGAVLPFSGVRGVAPGRDSLLVFVEGDPAAAVDDRWVRTGIATVAAGSCGSEPAIVLGVPGLLAALPGGQLASVVVGGPVRTEEVMRIKAYASAGNEWVGAQSLSASETVQPVLGPIVPGGFRLTYLDGLGGVAATAAAVRAIEVTLVVRSERVARAPGGGPAALLQDTAITRVVLRNAPR